MELDGKDNYLFITITEKGQHQVLPLSLHPSFDFTFFSVGFGAAGVSPVVFFCVVSVDLVNLWSDVIEKLSVNIGSFGSAKYIFVALAILILLFWFRSLSGLLARSYGWACK